MRDSSFAYHWRPAAVLLVGGSDAFGFLQGQFSNDLRDLRHRPSVYGLWLNAKGRVLADSFVLRGTRSPEEFYVISYFSPAGMIRDRLETYLIADDVTVTDETGEWFGHTLVGGEAIKVPERESGTLVFHGRRGFDGSLEWVSRTSVRFSDRRILSSEEMEQTRLRAGIPTVPIDIGPADLPQEGGFETEAISSTKGCYLGQEVMARLKSMGQVRRQLLRVTGLGPLPACPAPLFQGEKKVGELRSVVMNDDQQLIGLALVTLRLLDRPAGLSLAPEGARCVHLVPER